VNAAYFFVIAKNGQKNLDWKLVRQEVIIRQVRILFPAMHGVLFSAHRSGTGQNLKELPAALTVPSTVSR
jgi:hypothetical protein